MGSGFTDNFIWMLKFILSAVLGLTCEDQSQLSAGLVICGSVYMVVAYPLIWSLWSDLGASELMIAECDQYDHLQTITSIGSIFGVMFYGSWCTVSYVACCCFECFELSCVDWTPNCVKDCFLTKSIKNKSIPLHRVVSHE